MLQENNTIYIFDGTYKSILSKLKLILYENIKKMEFFILSDRSILFAGLITKFHTFFCENDKIYVNNELIFSIDPKYISDLHKIYTKFNNININLFDVSNDKVFSAIKSYRFNNLIFSGASCNNIPDGYSLFYYKNNLNLRMIEGRFKNDKVSGKTILYSYDQSRLIICNMKNNNIVDNSILYFLNTDEEFKYSNAEIENKYNYYFDIYKINDYINIVSDYVLVKSITHDINDNSFIKKELFCRKNQKEQNIEIYDNIIKIHQTYDYYLNNVKYIKKMFLMINLLLFIIVGFFSYNLLIWFHII